MPVFRYLNSSEAAPGNGCLPERFSVKANPLTDAWTNPPTTERFNAPILHCTSPLNKFNRAQVTIHADLANKYDQGGLMLVSKEQDGTLRWVKAGLELVDDVINLSTVSKDRGSDWGFQKVPGCKAVTLEMKREKQDTLWVYLVDEKNGKIPLREVTWLFQGEELQECLIGVYAARPCGEAGALIVNFEKFVVDLN